MPYNANAAVEYLNRHAHNHSTGFCARAVRLAILAGGVDITPHPPVARLYGHFLRVRGFRAVASSGYSPQKGDVIVIQSYPGGHPAGHIAMYNGSQWISDFRQRDMWAGPGYRTHKPSYTIYRH